METEFVSAVAAQTEPVATGLKKNEPSVELFGKHKTVTFINTASKVELRLGSRLLQPTVSYVLQYI